MNPFVKDLIITMTIGLVLGAVAYAGLALFWWTL